MKLPRLVQILVLLYTFSLLPNASEANSLQRTIVSKVHSIKGAITQKLPRPKKVAKFLNMARALAVSSVIPSTPFIRMLPTDACNLKCKYCWQRRDDPRQMSGKQFNQYLAKAKEHHVGMMTFLGGEPMIWKGLFGAIESCTRASVMTDMTTNGTKLNQKSIDRLGKAGLDFLNISVDGITKTKVSSKNSIIIRQGLLKHLHEAKRKYGMHFRVNAVIHRKNFEEIKQLIEFSKEHGIPISLGYIVPPLKKAQRTNSDLYFSMKDRALLNEIIGHILAKKKQGYKIIDPKSYFTDIFRFLKGEKFWDCNYPTKHGWINVTPTGELRSCTKKMDEVPGYTFLGLNKKKIKSYKQVLQKKVDQCNTTCYSNCAYDSAYYKNNKGAALKKAFGLE